MEESDRNRPQLSRGGERQGEHRGAGEVRHAVGGALIYLDHNASTPVRPEVVEAMRASLVEHSANPSSLHREGQRVRSALEQARAQVASLVHAHRDEVVFVSGGTEGDHLALVGAAWSRIERGRRIAISAVEHHAIHGAAELLAEQGFAVDHLPVGPDGRVSPDHLRWESGTTVVALMLANNETGVLEPVEQVARSAHEAGALVVCDAVQAAGKVPVDFVGLGVDYLIVSGHKIGGPKGAGALIVRRGAPLAPLFRGSGHEAGRRGGTENVSGIVGLGVAAEAAARELEAEGARLAALRARLEEGLARLVPDVVIHGAHAPRLPNTVNASFREARSDRLLMALDAAGIAVSAGAACASGAVEPSPVLAAMGVPRALAVCALRFSLGRTTTEAEIEATLAALGPAVAAARGSASGAGGRA